MSAAAPAWLKKDVASRAREAHLPNEDRAGSVGNVAWVLDGAASPPEVPKCCECDAVWLVDRMDRALRSVLTTDPSLALTAALKLAILATQEAHVACCSRPDAHLGPSSTVAIARLDHRGAEVLVLGDSVILVEQDGEVAHLSDHRLQNVAAALRSRVRMGDDNARAELVAKEKAERNRASGYWIVADDPIAADHAVLARFEGAVSTVALFTDGAYRARHPFRLLPNDQELLHITRREGAASILQRVRAAEESDPTRTRFPRSGKTDDATIALLWLADELLN